MPDPLLHLDVQILPQILGCLPAKTVLESVRVSKGWRTAIMGNNGLGGRRLYTRALAKSYLEIRDVQDWLRGRLYQFAEIKMPGVRWGRVELRDVNTDSAILVTRCKYERLRRQFIRSVRAVKCGPCRKHVIVTRPCPHTQFHQWLRQYALPRQQRMTQRNRAGGWLNALSYKGTLIRVSPF